MLVATTQGSILRLAPTLDEKGDLRIVGVTTLDLRLGFRYVIAVVSREKDAKTWTPHSGEKRKSRGRN